MLLALFALLDGAIVIISLSNLEFGRELLIYIAWTALWALLTIPLTDAMTIISKKISKFVQQ